MRRRLRPRLVWWIIVLAIVLFIVIMSLRSNPAE